MLIKQIKRKINEDSDYCIAEYGEETINYGEIEKYGHRIAAYIQNQKGTQHSVVLMLENPLHLLCAIYGLLISEKTVVLLNPQMPDEYRKNILNDRKKEIIISDIESEEMHFHSWNKIIRGNKEICTEFDRLTQIPFVIYTSGTTGTPVAIPVHRGTLCNYIMWFQKECQKKEIMSMQMLCTPYFSFGLCMSLIGFCSRIKIEFPDGRMRKNVFFNLQYLKENPKDLLVWPTAYLKAISASDTLINRIPGNIKLISAGGETMMLRKPVLEKLHDMGIILHNSFGSSETLGIFNYEVDYNQFTKEQNLIPVGTTIDNVIYKIEDEQGNPASEGILFLKFLFENNLTNGDEWFRTGDWVREDSLGCYVIGRTDHIVKIRGFRVNLQEVEKVINYLTETSESCVWVEKEVSDISELYAVYTGKEEADSLQKLLRNKLPEYMVPGKLFHMDELPHNQNGKIDRLKIRGIIKNEKEL